MKSLSLILALLLALVLATTSLFVGVSNVSLTTLFAPDTSADALRVLLAIGAMAYFLGEATPFLVQTFRSVLEQSARMFGG